MSSSGYTRIDSIDTTYDPYISIRLVDDHLYIVDINAEIQINEWGH